MGAIFAGQNLLTPPNECVEFSPLPVCLGRSVRYAILESVAVFDEISCVQTIFGRASTCAVTAETFNCACVRAQVSTTPLLLRCH